MEQLGDDEIRQELGRLDGWERGGGEIRKEYRFPDFAGSIAFVNRVAGFAEAADHHPDIDIRFDRVQLVLSTHSAGGLTSRDFELARRIDTATPA